MSTTTCRPGEELLIHRPHLNACLTDLQSEHAPTATRACNKYCNLLDEYLQLPALLDPILPTHTNTLCSLIHTRLIALTTDTTDTTDTNVDLRLADTPARALYTLAKVRGPKPFSTHLPHTVAHLRFLLPALLQADRLFTGASTWHLRYAIFLWLSVAIRAPFPLRTIFPPDTITSAVTIAQSAALAATDRVADTAAVFLARLLARRDVPAARHDVVSAAITSAANATVADVRAAALSLLAAIFKLAHRDDLTEHVASTLPLVDCQSPDATTEAHRLAKLAHRLALAGLPPRPAAWRYTRPTARLFARPGHFGPVAVSPSAPPTSAALQAAETVVAHLLDALRHRDTVVRWGAAKGLARVAARLPASLAADVASAALALFDDPDETRADAAAHGACLAVAELARRGLLLPTDALFADALAAIRTAAAFDLRRGAHSVGAHVRDAACYAVWAVARAYARDDVAAHAPIIAEAMLPVALLDREVNCRRAAAAALQECVGRLSDELFPEGIALVTLADYFALGDRNAAYLSIAPKVVALAGGVYFPSVLLELSDAKLVHWDPAVRTLAANALAAFVPVDKGNVILRDVVPQLVLQSTKRSELIIRHGAVLGLSELVKMYSAEQLGAHGLDIRRIPISLQELGLLTGKTGDEMRIACCRLMRSLAASESKTILSTEDGRRDIDRWLKILERILGCGKEHMYAEATSAYEAICRSVIATDKIWHVQVTRRILLGMSHGKFFELQRGHALAAGACGDSDISQEVVSTLCKVVSENEDVEVRRNAITSLGRLSPSLIQSRIVMVLEALTHGMHDYAKDERGDVGSWVREASMAACCTIIDSIFGEDARTMVERQTLCARTHVEKGLMAALHGILEQCCGKIDRVRSLSGSALKSFCSVFTGSSVHPRLTPLCEQLQKCFMFVSTSEDNSEGIQNNGSEESEINFAKAESVFPAMSGALRIKAVCDTVLCGILAGGDGTRPHVRCAVSVLSDFVRTSSGSEQSAAGWLIRGVTRVIFGGDERVYIPTLNLLGAACIHGILDIAPREDVIAAVRAIRASWLGRLRDVRRTMAAVRTLEDLSGLSGWEGGLDFGPGSVARECLEASVIVLGGQIPRLRRIAAESLYMILLRCDGADGASVPDLDICDEVDETIEDDPERAQKVRSALDVLTSTSWENVRVEAARQHRNLFCELLGIQQPVLKSKLSVASKN